MSIRPRPILRTPSPSLDSDNEIESSSEEEKSRRHAVNCLATELLSSPKRAFPDQPPRESKRASPHLLNPSERSPLFILSQSVRENPSADILPRPLFSTPQPPKRPPDIKMQRMLAQQRSRRGAPESNIYTRSRNDIQARAQRGEVDFLGKGTYKEAYRVGNEVHKVYLLDHGNSFQKFNSWTKHALEQHEQCLKLGLPCARILNNPLEEGVIIQELVTPLKESPLYDLTSQETNIDLEARKKMIDDLTCFFITALVNNLDLDIRLDNLGINMNGELCLMDFKEDEENSSLDGVPCCLSTCLKAIGRNCHPTFHKDLAIAIQTKIQSDAQITEALQSMFSSESNPIDFLLRYFTI